MELKQLSILDLEELNFFAEDIIHELRFKGYAYNEEGEYILDEEIDEVGYLIVEWVENQDNYLDFRKNKVLQEITFMDALKLSLEEIKERFLKGVLKKARGMMRKGTLSTVLMCVSDEIGDEYLDNLIALRYKENLKLWAIQREKDSGALC